MTKSLGNYFAKRHAGTLGAMLSERSPEGRMWRRLHPLPAPSADRPIQMGIGVQAPGSNVEGTEGFKKGGRVTRSFRYYS
jgi:hypothetical protein